MTARDALDDFDWAPAIRREIARRARMARLQLAVLYGLLIGLTLLVLWLVAGTNPVSALAMAALVAFSFAVGFNEGRRP